MIEIAILGIAIIYTLTVIMLWNMNDKVTKLEALTKCLESEMIALRKQINKDIEGSE